jgi:putative addiction module component (TIGR02574 family)
MPTTATVLEQARALSRPERLELLASLWESLDRDGATVTDSERKLLDLRLAEHSAAPDKTVSADEVHRQLARRKAR